MASPNIEFYQIGSSIRKLGKYFEFNTRLAVRTLSGNQQNVLMLESGSATPLQAVNVFSDEEAATLFGRGSMAHLMATEAIGCNSYLQLQIIGISDDSVATAASGKVTVTGTATASGALSLWVGTVRVDVAISANDTVATVAAALNTAIAQKTALPVTAAVAAGVVMLTAKNKGAAGNDIKLSAGSTATGITVAAMSGGGIDPDIAPALAAVFAAGHNIVVSPYATSAALTALRTHLDNVSGPLEQRGAIGVAGWPKSLSTGTTLVASINNGRITVGWHNGSVKTSAQIAAAYAAVIASEEDPARPLNTLAMSTLDVTALADRPGRNEQENALYNGLTPFEVGSGDTVQIVRAIRTYTKNADGVDDVSLLESPPFVPSTMCARRVVSVSRCVSRATS